MNPSQERAIANRSGAERCRCYGDCGKHRNRCVHRDGERMFRAGGGTCRLRDYRTAGGILRACSSCGAKFAPVESNEAPRPTSVAAPTREFIPYSED